MVKNIDDLVLLLLRCDGKQAAVVAYQEETGVSHARAVRAVERVARRHHVTNPNWTTKRTYLAGATVALAALLYAAFNVWL